MSYIPYNPNPCGKSVGDCTVRAVSKATGTDWISAYTALALEGFRLGNMPSADDVWGSYLRRQGFVRRVIPDKYPSGYTVADFAAEHQDGTYILSLSGHVVTVSGGNWYDSWGSGAEIPLYYWSKA